MSKKIKQLITANPNINLKPFNLQNTFSNLLQQAAKLGKNTTQASIKYSVWTLILNENCKYINNVTKETINNDFFFDDIHPNTWEHQQIGNLLYKIVNK